MATKFSELVDAAIAAHEPKGTTARMGREEASAVVAAVLKALRVPNTAMLGAAGASRDPQMRFTAAVDCVLRTADRDAFEVRPVVQGVGYEYLRDGRVVGRILQCMDGRSWSVTVPGKRWRLPDGHMSRLIHPNGIMDCTYRPSRERAEALVATAVRERRKVLDWPEAA